MRRPDRHCQPAIRDRPCRRLTLQPGIVTALRHLQHPAHQHYRKIPATTFHERVLCSDSLAKYAAAFFNRSRSSRASANSRRRRLFSASMSLTALPLWPASHAPDRDLRTQLAKVFADMFKRRATSGPDNVPSKTVFTACSRNSWVNDCLGNFAIFLPPSIYVNKLMASIFLILPQQDWFVDAGSSPRAWGTGIV